MSVKLVVVLSGEIASGKSAIAECLESEFGFKRFRTRDLLIAKAKLDHPSAETADYEEFEKREFLQPYGAKLDRETKGLWVRDAVLSLIQGYERVIIDAARIHDQIIAIRHAYEYRVVHIHAHAEKPIRKQWYIQRNKEKNPALIESDLMRDFESFSQDDTERKVLELKAVADLVVYTADSKNPKDYAYRVGGYLRLFPNLNEKNVDVVIGGQFGSEGKGQIAAYLSPEYDCLVRVGGPNAGHKVYAEDEHGNETADVFHMIPSGSKKNLDAKIVIGSGAVINIDRLLQEIKGNGLEHSRILIDENATLITQLDIEREKELDNIGSTAQGVGAATAQNILRNRLSENQKFKAKNANALLIRNMVGSAQEEFQKYFGKNKKLLLEGTQGTLLSIHHGFYPHVTSQRNNSKWLFGGGRESVPDASEK